MKWLSKLLTILLTISIYLTQAQELSYTIYFDTDSEIMPDSAMWPIGNLLHKYQIKRVLIEGHCDNKGSREYNINLSKKRAKEIKRFLLANGILNQHIHTCIGMGKEKPINDNLTEEQRSLNRRVVLKLYTDTLANADTTSLINKKSKYTISNPDKENRKQFYLNIDSADIGDKIVLKNIYFVPGTHRIKQESNQQLYHLLSTLNHYPNLVIQIEGHVCCVQDENDGYDWDTHTENLSLNRALAIREFLHKQGVALSRLQYKGLGGTQKVEPEELDETQRAANRRVEIKILRK